MGDPELKTVWDRARKVARFKLRGDLGRGVREERQGWKRAVEEHSSGGRV